MLGVIFLPIIYSNLLECMFLFTYITLKKKIEIPYIAE